MKGFWIYLAILVGSTYLIRAVPFAAVNKKIQNRFVRSFLFYIPYTVLAAMTFPAAVYATDNAIAASCALVIGGVVALKGKSLTVVAVVCCLVSLSVELLLTHGLGLF